jgi:hypothetical protein
MFSVDAESAVIQFVPALSGKIVSAAEPFLPTIPAASLHILF